jgi:hypothetical protein
MACTRRRIRVAKAPKVTTAVVLANLMGAPGLIHAADNASIIYAAENALYGAGYQIGQADGWMDRQLRTAIRQFQSSQEDLTANGTLDARTLDALSIHYSPAMAISENHLDSPKAARLALGLPAADTSPSKPEPATKPPTRSVDTAEPTVPVAQPEPVNAPEPDIAMTEPPETEEQAPQPEEQDIQIIAQVEKDPVSQLPTEPTSAGPSTPVRPDAAAVAMTVESPPAVTTAAPVPPAIVTRERSSGFLASLFDFLFGWLI